MFAGKFKPTHVRGEPSFPNRIPTPEWRWRGVDGTKQPERRHNDEL